MADLSINMSGEMDPVTSMDPKQGFTRFLRFPTQIPDAKDWLAHQRQNVRPWLLFVQTSNFKVPPSIPRLSIRIMRNIEYFQSNYLYVFFGLAAYCLITSPLLLLALCGSFYAGYRLSKRHQEKKFLLFGKELTLAQQYGLVMICSLPLFYLVGAHAAAFWVLGASITVITLHAAFYNIDALSNEDASFGLTEEV